MKESYETEIRVDAANVELAEELEAAKRQLRDRWRHDSLQCRREQAIAQAI